MCKFTSVLFSLLAPCFLSCLLWAQGANSTATPVQMLVTLGHHYGHPPPHLTRDDLIVTQQLGDPLRIVSLLPMRGENAPLEMYVLVDNCSNCEPGSKFEEIRSFILAQPRTTSVGVAYLQDGRFQVAEKPTPDHERAVKALNVPTGAKPANPYGPVTELIRNWPQTSVRRAIVMISTGMNPAAQDDSRDPSAEALIAAAQRARVPIYAIYHPSADYFGTDSSKLYSAQVQLSHVANETGGEAYFLYFGPLPSLGPFLTDIAEHLADQYLLEFLVTPTSAKGSFQNITVKSKTGEVELVVPSRVWVPSAK